MKIVEKMINSISYKKRREKKLITIEKNVKKYMNMPSNEFLMEYVETKSKYEHKKFLFTVVFITVLLSIIMDTWNYFYNFLIKLIISENTIIMQYESSVKLLLMVIVICVTGVIILIIIYKIKAIYKLNKKLIFMEEIKEIRMNG